jgi:hypothetical protein
MADVSVTAGNVAISAEATTILTVQAGESITQGQPVYRSSSTGKYLRADANDTAAKAEALGIALTPASTDGYFLIATDGEINIGGTLVKGSPYYVSNAVGGIAPFGDLTTNDYVTILGHAKTTAILQINIVATGIQKA